MQRQMKLSETPWVKYKSLIILAFLVLLLFSLYSISAPKQMDSRRAILMQNRIGGSKLVDVSSAMHVQSFTATLSTKTGPAVFYVYPIDSTPPFAFALADISVEGVARSIIKDGILEQPTQEVFRYLLSEKCTQTKEGQLVVDLGANLGYFTTYSAVMGCRVKSVEPQPRLLDIFNFSLSLNGVRDRVQLYNNIVTDEKGKKLKIMYAEGCWACSWVESAKEGEVDTEKSYIIPSIAVDEFVNEDVLLLKIDVEGFEVHALKSAKNLFKNHKVRNILIEWNPARFPRAHTTIEESTGMLEQLSMDGYVIRHYELRMQYPRQGLPETVFPYVGKTYEIPKDKIQKFNQWLVDNRAEANIWLSKRYPGDP